jgi:hypothetical protein
VLYSMRSWQPLLRNICKLCRASVLAAGSAHARAGMQLPKRPQVQEGVVLAIQRVDWGKSDHSRCAAHHPSTSLTHSRCRQATDYLQAQLAPPPRARASHRAIDVDSSRSTIMTMNARRIMPGTFSIGAHFAMVNGGRPAGMVPTILSWPW